MKLLLIALLILPVIFNAGIVFGDTSFKSMGDVGCKSTALSNIKNVAKDGNSFFGAGDYSYKCKSSKIKPLWDKVPNKQLAPGNHECEKSKQDSLKVGSGYSSNGGCKKGYGMFFSADNSVAIFVMSQYASYDTKSAQYKFVSENLAKVDNMTNIKVIFVVFHEPIYPVNCKGDHCHGLDKPKFKSTYEALFKEHNVIVIAAHTHLVAFGTVSGVRTAVCGGGGEDGTGLNGLGAYTYVSNKMSFCYFHVQGDKVIVEQIDTTGKVIHTHSWGN